MMNVSFKNRIDRYTIEDSSVLEVSVHNGYSSALAPDDLVDVKTFDSTKLEAFAKSVDAFTWLFEENAFIWKIDYVAKVFNLESSYIRDVESTETPLTAIPDATPLVVIFEVPGFETGRTAELSLWLNTAFLPLEIDAVRNLGVIVSGNGSEFTIDNSIDCKVSFRRPDGVTDVYVIDNPYNGQIITV